MTVRIAPIVGRFEQGLSALLESLTTLGYQPRASEWQALSEQDLAGASLVLLDGDGPVWDKNGAVRRLGRRTQVEPHLKLVLCLPTNDLRRISLAMDAGIHACLIGSVEHEALAEALDQISAGVDRLIIESQRSLKVSPDTFEKPTRRLQGVGTAMVRRAGDTLARLGGELENLSVGSFCLRSQASFELGERLFVRIPALLQVASELPCEVTQVESLGGGWQHYCLRTLDLSEGTRRKLAAEVAALIQETAAHGS